MTDTPKTPEVVVFSAPEKDKIVDTFTQAFQLHLRPTEGFTVVSAVADDKLLVQMELADADRDEVLTLEAACDVEVKKLSDLLEKRTLLIEFLYAVLDEYFKGERWPRPNLDWKEFTYEGLEVLHRGSVVAERLERMADALLAGELEDA